MKFTPIGVLASALLLSACGSDSDNDSEQVTRAQVESHFANMAHAMVEDSLTAASNLKTAVNTLLATPSDDNLTAAKAAYKSLRLPYQQFEITRFDVANNHVTTGDNGPGSDGGLANVDDWEGQVNAWPLDEALIDYVDGNYRGEVPVAGTSINIINATSGDLSGAIDANFLMGLNEFADNGANVATGIHAIEFLLWGQDQSTGAGNLGTGERPVSDYAADASCTSGATINASADICIRRGQYLTAVTELLVSDLSDMEVEWNVDSTGLTLRSDFIQRGDGLERVLDSMGDMAIGELASERMSVAILLNSTEDEHDCFSDLTHVAIYGNALGVIDAYLGSYTRLDGSQLTGASISDLVKQNDASADTHIRGLLATVDAEFQDIQAAAADGKTFDMLVGSADDSIVKEAIVALDALNVPFSSDVASALNVSLQGIDEGTCPVGSAAAGECIDYVAE
ncbi:MAG: imelysin family protein [Bermanella sp.]